MHVLYTHLETCRYTHTCTYQKSTQMHIYTHTQTYTHASFKREHAHKHSNIHNHIHTQITHGINISPNTDTEANIHKTRRRRHIVLSSGP